MCRGTEARNIKFTQTTMVSLMSLTKHMTSCPNNILFIRGHMVTLIRFETAIRQKLVSSINIRGGGGDFETTIFQFHVELVRCICKSNYWEKCAQLFCPKTSPSSNTDRLEQPNPSNRSIEPTKFCRTFEHLP